MMTNSYSIISIIYKKQKKGNAPKPPKNPDNPDSVPKAVMFSLLLFLIFKKTNHVEIVVYHIENLEKFYTTLVV